MSSKITALTALPLASAQGDDVVAVVDVHDTSMASTGTDKKFTLANLARFATGRYNLVADFGMDPTGTFDNATQMAAMATAIGTSPVVITGPPGTYKTSVSLPSLVQGQSMRFDSPEDVTFQYTGSGLALTTTVNGSFTGGQYAGAYEGFTIDGYSAGSGAVGWQIGDLQGGDIVDVTVQGFGGGGAHWQHTSGWAEQWTVRMRLIGCGTSGTTPYAVVFDTTSFDYGDFDFTIEGTPGCGGISLVNSCQVQGCRIRMRGNFQGQVSNAAAVVALEPAGGGGTSVLINADLDIAVESAGSNAAPYALIMGSSSAASQFSGQGVFSCSNVAGNFQGVSNSNSCPVGFSGLWSDGVNVPANGDGLQILGGSGRFVSRSLTGTLFASNIYFQFNDIQPFTLAAGAQTLVFNGLASFIRDLTLVLRQPPSGGLGTVTWPTITWASGSPPTLPASNGGELVVRLLYLPAAAAGGSSIIFGWVPGATGSSVTIDTTTGDIAASPGTAAAGSVGLAADSGHVHPQPAMFAPTGLTGAVQASRYAGATASGHPASGTYAVGDFTVDQSGSFWICTTAGTPGTWTQVVAGSVVGGVPAIDSTASDIQPDGVRAAGSTGKAADAGHIHAENANQSLLIAPSGTVAETFPRYVGTSQISPSNSTVYAAAIALPKGVTVTSLTFVTSGGESGASHGWYALLDSTGKVLAVTADQTGTSWSATGAVTIALGSAYTTTAAGAYYAAISITASGRPNIYSNNVINSFVAGISPLIAATGGTQAAPPSVGATLTLSSTTGGPYAYAT